VRKIVPFQSHTLTSYSVQQTFFLRVSPFSALIKFDLATTYAAPMGQYIFVQSPTSTSFQWFVEFFTYLSLFSSYLRKVDSVSKEATLAGKKIFYLKAQP
jgi:hypothetical protein